MAAWAEQARLRPDSKAAQLIAGCQATLRPNGRWNDERVIIFTEYRATQKWLQGLLAAAGLTENGRLMVLFGGMKDEEREGIKAAFQAHPSLTVRCASCWRPTPPPRGLTSRTHCHRLIHYEIPWNPNRMEQRNGRIDRHGQRHSPEILHFAPQGFERGARRGVPAGDLEGDLEFLMRAVQKVEQIREDLGKVGPVIAAQVADAMLGRGGVLATEQAEREAGATRALLRFERDLRARIQRLHERLLDSRAALHLSPDNVRAVVEIALELANQPPLQPAELVGLWPDPTGQRREPPLFHLPTLRGSWARSADGLAHPLTGERRPIVFDHDLARGRDDVVLVHLNHHLVQMALRLLRAEVWNPEGAQRLQRVTARRVPNHLLPEGPAVIAHARLVVIGGSSHRLHEELDQCGRHDPRGALSPPECGAGARATRRSHTPRALRGDEGAAECALAADRGQRGGGHRGARGGAHAQPGATTGGARRKRGGGHRRDPQRVGADDPGGVGAGEPARAVGA